MDHVLLHQYFTRRQKENEKQQQGYFWSSFCFTSKIWSKSPRIPEKSAFYNYMEKWPRIKTELESGLLEHQHFAQHSLFFSTTPIAGSVFSSGEIFQFLPIIVWLRYENPQSQRLLAIPLSKLRNASIGPKKHCMLVCYKCCMFAAHIYAKKGDIWKVAITGRGRDLMQEGSRSMGAASCSSSTTLSLDRSKPTHNQQKYRE